jgi:ubiquinone biosynthesis protein Coq4
VHDFWHVLFDCHTNVFGELALKALEFVQVRHTGVWLLRMTLL